MLGCGIATISTADVGIQHETGIAQPQIRQTRKTTEKIKSTCCEVSVKANMSNEAARPCVQKVCQSLLAVWAWIYLNKEETLERDPALEQYKALFSPKPLKMSRRHQYWTCLKQLKRSLILQKTGKSMRTFYQAYNVKLK